MSMTFFHLIAVILGLEAAIFISKANLGLTPEVIAGLSRTYWGYSPKMLCNLAAQNADNRVGIILLTVSVILQSALLLPSRSSDAQMISPAEVALAAAVAVVVFMLCVQVTRWRAKKLLDAAESIIKQRPESETP